MACSRESLRTSPTVRRTRLVETDSVTEGASAARERFAALVSNKARNASCDVAKTVSLLNKARLFSEIVIAIGPAFSGSRQATQIVSAESQSSEGARFRRGLKVKNR